MGKCADFREELRHTFIRNLSRAGVHPKAAQSLARHSTITLTMDLYSNTLRDQDRSALETLSTMLTNSTRPARTAPRLKFLAPHLCVRVPNMTAHVRRWPLTSAVAMLKL